MGRLRYLRFTGRQRVLIWLTVIFTLLLALTVAVVLHMKPVVVDLATARTSNAVNRIVVAAVNDAVDSGRIDYEQLVDFDKDADGHVTALRSNMAAIHRRRYFTAHGGGVLHRSGHPHRHADRLAAAGGTRAVPPCADAVRGDGHRPVR